MMKWLLGFSIVALVGLFAGARSLLISGSVDTAFITNEAKRQSIRTIISTTGTLEPRNVIDVGAQVAGRIVEFGLQSDGRPIDFGSKVCKGDILARIDPSMYERDVQIAKAQLARSLAQQSQAESQRLDSVAAIRRSKAEILQAEANLNRVNREWKRMEKLLGSRTVSETDADSTLAELEIRKAAVELAKAALEQSESGLTARIAALEAAKADIENSRAALARSENTLSYCEIKSPVDGVVIDRRINQGQTVVASLNTPSLFLIASDLRDMQIWVSVNEADIGQIVPGMKAEFTVDTYPNEVFCGEVSQLRLNASVNQNVVTYTVVVDVANSKQRLIPYLTADVSFILDEKTDVLCVPNAALRFSPSPLEKALPKEAVDSTATLWTIDNGTLRPISVQVGITDGLVTQIVSNECSEGMSVVTDRKGKTQTSAPVRFLPKPPTGK